MSCYSNIDPYNNAPPGSAGKCGMKPSSQPSPQMSAPPPMSNFENENQMLKSDLNVAINYIRKLGGKWPPPGQ